MMQLYSMAQDNPRVIRIAIRMRDKIDEGPLRSTAHRGRPALD